MRDICPFTHKHTYLSRTRALRRCFDGMEPYICRFYPHWHVGHPWKSLKARKTAEVAA